MPLPRLNNPLRVFVRASAKQPGQSLGHRAYATEHREEAKRTSNLPWLIASVGLGAPAAAYLVRTGPEKKAHYGNHLSKEAGEAVERRQAAQGSAHKRPSDVDSAGATKFPEGIHTMSGKQAGLDNANSSNPMITAPGKSVKGEGDTETTKLQGTVDPNRRPA